MDVFRRSFDYASRKKIITSFLTSPAAATSTETGSGRHRAPMTQRPDQFWLNPYSPLAEGLVFAGLGGLGCVGSMVYPDATRHLGLEPNDGTMTNMTSDDWTWVPELGRWALDYDGTNDYVQKDVGLVADVPLTLAAWVRSDSSTANQTVVWVGDKDSDGLMYGIRLNGSSAGDPVGAYTYAGSFYESTKIGYTAGKWHHVVGVFSSRSSRLVYLDGDAGTEETTYLNVTGIDRFAIGRLARATPAAYFNGQIADVCVYNRALTEAEIQALADPSNASLSLNNNPLILPAQRKSAWVSVPTAVTTTPTTAVRRHRTPMTQRPDQFRLNPHSPLAEGLVFAGLGGLGCVGSMVYPDATRHIGLEPNDGTLTNMATDDWTWVPELGRWALDFDGSDDHARIAPVTFNTANKWAWFCWFNRSTTSGSRSVFGDGDGFARVVWGNANAVYISNDSNHFSAETFATSVGTWTPCLLMSRGDSTNVDLYNGDTVEATCAKGGYFTLRDFGRGYSAYYWAGKIADGFVWNRGLSEAEIQALADPSNVDLSVNNMPLILPARRRFVYSSSAAISYVAQRRASLRYSPVTYYQLNAQWPRDRARDPYPRKRRSRQLLASGEPAAPITSSLLTLLGAG